jgi:hypothetical protein
MTTRILKTHDDIAMTEVTRTDGEKVLQRSYCVRAASDPASTKTFEDMAAAAAYFEDLIIRRLNPQHRVG